MMAICSLQLLPAQQSSDQTACSITDATVRTFHAAQCIKSAHARHQEIENKEEEEARTKAEKAAAEKSAFERLQEDRRSLPMYEYREMLLEALEQHQILIVTAETGSGKTTQVQPSLQIQMPCRERLQTVERVLWRIMVRFGSVSAWL